MSEIPVDLRYSENHEWARLEDDGRITVGITDHAQVLLGDLVFVEPPEVDAQVSAGESCATVESVKAASDVYAPISGTVTETNAELADAPEQVNTAPYAEGWLFRIQPDDPTEWEGLMDAEAYAAHIASEA